MTRIQRTPLRERIAPSPTGTDTTVEGEAPDVRRTVVVRPARPGRPEPIAPTADDETARLNAEWKWAQTLAQSKLVNATFQENPANVMWGINYARALEVDPMVILQGIYADYRGRPTMTSQLMVGLVQRRGHRIYTKTTGGNGDGPLTVEAFGIRAEDADPASIKAWRDLGIDPVYRSSWTMAKALQAGLVEYENGRYYSRDGYDRPMPWELYPSATLRARARAETARDGFADALAGVVYTPEELGMDVGPDEIPLSPVSGVDIDPDPAYEPDDTAPLDGPAGAPDEDRPQTGEHDPALVKYLEAVDAAIAEDDAEQIGRIVAWAESEGVPTGPIQDRIRKNG